MHLVATKPPEGMTPADRLKLAAYSGWGGLSIAKNRDRFPPGLVPEDFGLIHEYYTPKRVADAIAQAVCPRSAPPARSARSSRRRGSGGCSAR